MQHQKLQSIPMILITKKCKSDFTRRLEAGVEAVIENEEWRLEYMTLNMRDRENIEAGREEGRKEGRREGRREGRVSSIIDLLGDIGTVSEELKEKIYEEKDVDILKEWLRLAKKADIVEEFQKKM